MATLKYRAFLSYSHRDTAWAKWLHRALESYRIDKDLVGRETLHGPVPKMLRPVFRDREDFSAGHSLNDQTVAALEASQFLIALCSPNAARSEYVNEEIRYFKARGGAVRVIPLIIDGEPGDPERECFPPAIRYRIGADGGLSDEREEPIAADARPQGDGKEIAKRKVVAALLGVGLDEIMRRAERARKRRNRIRIGALGVVVLVIAGGIVGWTGALSVSSRLDSSELLIIKADAADICERASERAAADNVPEVQRIAFAMKCVTVLSTGLNALPQNVHVPLSLISYLEDEVAALQEVESAGKLTSEQVAALAKAETLLEAIQRR
jgi:hypothetical protein